LDPLLDAAEEKEKNPAYHHPYSGQSRKEKGDTITKKERRKRTEKKPGPAR